MKFRIFILHDPHAKIRGFSLKGIKVPLRTWVPVLADEEDIATFDGKKLEKGQYVKFWKLACEDIVRMRPPLARYLDNIDHVLIPCEFCDVAPVERWDEAWGQS